MTPQHFLVPLDFSDYSTQALNYPWSWRTNCKRG